MAGLALWSHTEAHKRIIQNNGETATFGGLGPVSTAWPGAPAGDPSEGTCLADPDVEHGSQTPILMYYPPRNEAVKVPQDSTAYRSSTGDSPQLPATQLKTGVTVRRDLVPNTRDELVDSTQMRNSHPGSINGGHASQRPGNTPPSGSKDYLRQELTVNPKDPISLWSLPDPEQGQRPPHAYPLLISLAIQGSPKQRLTMKQICDAIEERFEYYKNQPQGVWKDAIQDNLSLNPAFKSIPQSQADPGKGSYWEVVRARGEGSEQGKGFEASGNAFTPQHVPSEARRRRTPPQDTRSLGTNSSVSIIEEDLPRDSRLFSSFTPMAPQLLSRILRRVKGSQSTRSLKLPPLSAGFHVDLHRRDPGDASNVSVGAAERKQRAVLEALYYPVPELANISGRKFDNGTVTLTVPEGMDFDGLIWQLQRSPSFNWEMQGYVDVRREFNAHSVRYERTLSNVWYTPAEAIRRRVVRKRDETMQKATQWIESFVSGADPDVLSRIRSSIDMSIIWDRLVYCIDESLEGCSLDESTSPGKDITAPMHTAFFTLGVFNFLGCGGLKVKIYSVRLTVWANFSAGDVFLRSGIRGEFKCEEYRVPTPLT